MDQEIKNLQSKVDEQAIKIDAIYASIEKTRKYFLIMTWVTVITIVLPMIALVFVIPSFISNYTSTLNDLGI